MNFRVGADRARFECQARTDRLMRPMKTTAMKMRCAIGTDMGTDSYWELSRVWTGMVGRLFGRHAEAGGGRNRLVVPHILRGGRGRRSEGSCDRKLFGD